MATKVKRVRRTAKIDVVGVGFGGLPARRSMRSLESGKGTPCLAPGEWGSVTPAPHPDGPTGSETSGIDLANIDLVSFLRVISMTWSSAKNRHFLRGINRRWLTWKVFPWFVSENQGATKDQETESNS